MADAENAARWQRFAKMRLSGKNDLIYRNYDLLSGARHGASITIYLRAAGYFVPPSGAHDVLKAIQRNVMQDGYGVKTLGELETLLHEFWVYQRIKHLGKKNWPFRKPTDIARLNHENATAERVDTK
jgi:hypothetical protein